MLQTVAHLRAKETTPLRIHLRPMPLLALVTLLALGQTLAGSPAPAPAPTPRHSFLDPIGDFVRDDILRPVAPFQLVPARDPNGWTFVLEPYAWAMGLDGRIGVKGLPPSQVHFSSRTILQNLDWGVFARGEIRKGRWGLLADGYYAALSSSASAENAIYENASLGVQQSIVSLALAYRVIDDHRGYLDVYAGARYNFFGSQFDASLDDSRIDQISTSVVDALSTQIDSRIESAIASALSATQQAIESQVSQQLAEQPERKIFRKNRDLDRLVRDRLIPGPLVGGKIRAALRSYISAAAAAKIAEARGAVDARLSSAVTSAKKQLQQAIAGQIEAETPTHAAGNEWWIDPIIGLRGQVNLTRWLFLAAQGDVGGFSAGSDIAWNVQATIGINFTRNIFAEFGYRYMYVDYANGGFIYDMNSYGLFTGVGVKF